MSYDTLGLHCSESICKEQYCVNSISVSDVFKIRHALSLSEKELRVCLHSHAPSTNLSQFVALDLSTCNLLPTSLCWHATLPRERDSYRMYTALLMQSNRLQSNQIMDHFRSYCSDKTRLCTAVIISKGYG